MAHDRGVVSVTTTTRLRPPFLVARNLLPTISSSHSISASTTSVLSSSSSSSSLAIKSARVSNETRHEPTRARKTMGDEHAATSCSTVSTTSSMDTSCALPGLAARRAHRSTTQARRRRGGGSASPRASRREQEKNLCLAPAPVASKVVLPAYTDKEVPLTILESPPASPEIDLLSWSSGGHGSDREETLQNAPRQPQVRMKPSRMVVKRRTTVPLSITSHSNTTRPHPSSSSTTTPSPSRSTTRRSTATSDGATRRDPRPRALADATSPVSPRAERLERWHLRCRRSGSEHSSSTDEEQVRAQEHPRHNLYSNPRSRQCSGQAPASPLSLPATPRAAARKLLDEQPHAQDKARPVRIRYETPERGRESGKLEISHASLGKLIARLTDAHQYDTDFRDMFLLTYRCFCSPYDFVKKLLKRYKAVLSLCAPVTDETLEEMDRLLAERAPDDDEGQADVQDDEEDGGLNLRASTLTSISTARSDITSGLEANVSIMRLLSVVKFWIKESGYIEQDVGHDRRAQKKLGTLLHEIETTAPIPSIRRQAEALLVYVAHHVVASPQCAPISSSSIVTSPLALSAPKVPLARSSSDPKQKRMGSGRRDAPGGLVVPTPKIMRGITTGSTEAAERGMGRSPPGSTTTPARRAPTPPPSEPLTGLSATDLADQLTLIEAEQYFAPLDPRELTNKAWTREHKQRDAPHVMALIELFDATAEWVSSEILHPQLQAVARAKMITLFIDAAHQCLALHNFNTVFEITTGLSAPCIRHLNTTWSLVAPSALEKYQCLQHVCSPEENYRSYRQAFVLADGQPRLACWFLLVKDLFTYEEAMVSVEQGLVHWAKFRKIARVIGEALDRQNFKYESGGTAGGGKGRGGAGVRPDRQLQVYLRHRVDTIRKDSSVLYQLARNANTQESILFVNSLSEAGFL